MRRRDFLLTGISAAAAIGLPLRAGAQDAPKIAVILSPEGRGDLGWNDLAWHGSEVAKAEGLISDYTMLVSNSNENYALLDSLASSGEYAIIISCSSVYANSIVEIAAMYPEQNFGQLDMRPEATAESHPGVLAMLFNQEQMSALVGATAALLAAHYDRPHVGLVLGREVAVLQDFEIGYKVGVAWAIDWLQRNRPEDAAGKQIVDMDPTQRVLWTYTGTFADPAVGKTAAEVQIQQGAAVIYQVAGGTGLGVLSAVADYHDRGEVSPTEPPFALGVDADQDWINPYIIASGMKRVDMAVLEATRLAVGGTFRDAVQSGGGVYWLNLGNGGVAMSDETTLSTFTEFAVAAGNMDEAAAETTQTTYEALRAAQPDYVWEAVAELRAAIESGALEVPKPSMDPERFDMATLRATYG
jgi:basic membrane protein A